MLLAGMVLVIVGLGGLSVMLIVKIMFLLQDRRNERRVRNRRLRTQTENRSGTMIYFAENPHNLPDNEYRFDFKRVGNSWRAYILRTPSFGGRDSGNYITHRLSDDAGYFVCWDSPVATLHDMQAISRVWANKIQEYIATGRSFR